MIIILRVALGLVLLAIALIGAAVIANRVSLTAPPGFAVRLKTYLGAHHVVTAPDSPFPELRGSAYAVTPDALYAAVRAGVSALGWRLLSEDAARRRLHAVVSSRIWRFKDDVMIDIGVAPGGARLNISSQSRIGRGDLGANLRHILDLQAAVDARLPNLRR